MYWAASLLGWGFIAILCDSKMLGRRRNRAITIAGITTMFVIATWTSLIWFLISHPIDRQGSPLRVDWKDGSKFSHLLVIWFFLGSCWAIFQGYIVWLVSSFSNEPSRLSHYSGFVEGMRALGFAVAFGIDSHSSPFLSEMGMVFGLMLAGLVLCVVSATLYTTDSFYGAEERVVVPEAFDLVVRPMAGVRHGKTFLEKSATG
jgi:hypothetical protein